MKWKLLVWLAVKLCGQEAFQAEARILKRLVKQYGEDEVEKMLRGAGALGWDSLRALGSKEGLGRRMAIQAYWKNETKAPAAQSVGAILNEAMRRAK